MITIDLKYDLKNKSYTYNPVTLPAFLKNNVKNTYQQSSPSGHSSRLDP